MNNDFTWERIADWIEGRLSVEESTAFAAGLASADAAVQADVQWLRAFHKLGKTTPLKELSSAARQNLRSQFVQLKSPQLSEERPLAAAARAFRVFIATLTSDSWKMSLSGVRTANSNRDSRQLIFKTDVAEIALNIRPRAQDSVLDLRCQLFTEADIDAKTVSAQLVQNASFRQTQISDLGDFAFGNVVPGEYDLMFIGNDFEIALPKLSLSL